MISKRKKIWHAVAEAVIDQGYIVDAAVDHTANTFGSPPKAIYAAMKALDLVPFENGGNRYWRPSEKVVPIVPRRMFKPAAVAKG